MALPIVGKVQGLMAGALEGHSAAIRECAELLDDVVRYLESMTPPCRRCSGVGTIRAIWGGHGPERSGPCPKCGGHGMDPEAAELIQRARAL